MDNIQITVTARELFLLIRGLQWMEGEAGESAELTALLTRLEKIDEEGM